MQDMSASIFLWPACTCVETCESVVFVWSLNASLNAIPLFSVWSPSASLYKINSRLLGSPFGQGFTQTFIWPSYIMIRVFFAITAEILAHLLANCFGASEQQHKQVLKRRYRRAYEFSNIHHFLPRYILFNQSVLRHFYQSTLRYK